MKTAAGLLALALAVAGPVHAQSLWQVISQPPKPAAAYDAGDQGKIVILCDDNRGLHTYVLAISGPAGAMKTDAWVSVRVAGKRVNMTTEVKDGTATLTAASSTTRYATNDAPGDTEVYDAVDAMKHASSITIDSGEFRFTVPAAGLDGALADATATCGDPKTLSRQVKARSEP